VLRYDFEEDKLAAGDILGPYRLESPLGEGGAGVVFRAKHDDGRTVALKVLRAELGEDETYRRRFLHEARAAEEVSHDNLVPIVEAGEHEGRYYLATLYVEGSTVEQRVSADGPLPVPDVVRICSDIASALDALHDASIIHRDVKASNVMLRDDGTALLTDFGLAKGQAYTVLTAPGSVMGTIEYLAPELIRGEPATRASDLYALACTAFECTTGHTPFAASSSFQIGLAHLQENPPDPAQDRDDWTPALSTALLSGLAKDPAERPSTATEYADALRTAAGQSPE
jgi:serine/threonine protein kinase